MGQKVKTAGGPLAWILTHKLAIVLLIAVGVRVIFLFAFAGTLNFELPGNAVHGSEAYDEYALNLLATGVYGRDPGVPDAAIPPLYSYALAVVYGIFGRGFVQVGLFHTLLDALSIALLYDIGRRLFKRGALFGQPAGQWVGALAGLFFALYPYLVFHNLTLIDTPFWILLLHLFVWLVILLRERPRLDGGTLGIGALAGVALGLGMLARPIAPPLALLVALWFLFRLNLWQTIARLLPVALVGVACVVPWIVRNQGVFDAFVPMTTTSGANLWQGNSRWTVPVFEAGYDVQWTAPDPERMDYPLESREADAQRFALAVEYWQDNPDKIPHLLWTKFKVHWSIEIAPRLNPLPGEQWSLSDDGQRLIITPAETTIDGVTAANTAYNAGLMDTLGRPIHELYFGGLLLLALVGVVLSLRQWREVSLLWFVQISMTVVYMFFHPATRYRAPSDPLLFVFSAFALVALLMHLRADSTQGHSDAAPQAGT